jgi:hypothetical protein
MRAALIAVLLALYTIPAHAQVPPRTPPQIKADKTTLDSAVRAVPSALLEAGSASTLSKDASAYETSYLPARVLDDDVQNALMHVSWAWGNHGPCTRFFLCLFYIDHVEFRWTDGSVSFGPRIQRLTTSAHDCIQNAKNAVQRGEKPLAVEWVMASQIHNPPAWEWLRTHPDAVITALSLVH